MLYRFSLLVVCWLRAIIGGNVFDIWLRIHCNRISATFDGRGPECVLQMVCVYR